MKKLLVLMLSLLVSGVMLAQESGKTNKMNSVLAFHVGPSAPMSDFRSTSFDNFEAGFAKTGFTLNLSYGYQMYPNFGISTEVFYNKYNLDEEKIKSVFSMVDVDHWQFYGITAGPVVRFDLGSGISSNLRVMGGAANVNSPKAMIDGDLEMDEEWSWTTVVKAGLDFRFDVGKQFQIFTGVDYMYMRPGFPGFDIEPGEGLIESTIHQRISAVNATVGFGFRF